MINKTGEKIWVRESEIKYVFILTVFLEQKDLTCKINEMINSDKNIIIMNIDSIFGYNVSLLI